MYGDPAPCDLRCELTIAEFTTTTGSAKVVVTRWTDGGRRVLQATCRGGVPATSDLSGTRSHPGSRRPGSSRSPGPRGPRPAGRSSDGGEARGAAAWRGVAGGLHQMAHDGRECHQRNAGRPHATLGPAAHPRHARDTQGRQEKRPSTRRRRGAGQHPGRSGGHRAALPRAVPAPRNAQRRLTEYGPRSARNAVAAAGAADVGGGRGAQKWRRAAARRGESAGRGKGSRSRQGAIGTRRLRQAKRFSRCGLRSGSNANWPAHVPPTLLQSPDMGHCDDGEGRRESGRTEPAEWLGRDPHAQHPVHSTRGPTMACPQECPCRVSVSRAASTVT